MEWTPKLSSMNEETEDYEMENTLLILRKRADENQKDLDSRNYQREFTRNRIGPLPRTYKEQEKITESGGGFYVRTTLCLLIFCSFLWVKKENRSFLGMAPDKVQEVLGQSVVLQDIPDSVKISETQP